MASKQAMALPSTSKSRMSSSVVFDTAARFSAAFALLVCAWYVIDGWLPIPVASEELASVVVLLFLPLAFSLQHFSRQSSSKCRKTLAADESTDLTEVDTSSLETTASSLQSNHLRIATASLDGTVMLWGLTSGQCEQKLEQNTGPLRAVTFSADGSLLATAASDGAACIWDATTGECKHILDDGGGVVCSVALSPCAGLLLTGLDDHCAQLWRIPASDEAAQVSPPLVLEGHTSAVSSVAFSPCGTLAATGSWDGTARLWNVATGACEKVLEGHDAEVFSVAFSPYGEMLATASQDGTVRLWSVGAGWCIMTLDCHETAVRSAVFSPCGRLLATGCWDGSVKLWDVESGDCERTLQGASGVGPILGMAFSSQGSSIATVEGNGARVWNAETGACVRLLEGHTDIVQAVAIS